MIYVLGQESASFSDHSFDGHTLRSTLQKHEVFE